MQVCPQIALASRLQLTIVRIENNCEKTNQNHNKNALYNGIMFVCKNIEEKLTEIHNVSVSIRANILYTNN